MNTVVELLAKKRDRVELNDAEIDTLVAGYVNGDVADEQMAAFLMAVQLNGLTSRETLALTRAYVNSGVRLTYPNVTAPTVDKHSTGGVGDKITLILTPMLMALGAAVPQLSGRALGHTGGTLDKLEAIPGFTSTLTVERMRRQLQDIGGFICSASDELAPADRLIYALRDVTATVPSIPLIAASIMSKKLAEGTAALVLDVKVGHGAFMKTVADAEKLAHTLLAVGNGFNVNTRVVLSNMDRPLGKSAGNVLEVVEALDVLQGRGPADVRNLSVRLAVEMCEAVGIPATNVERVLDDGTALGKFRELVTAQGADLDKPLPTAEVTHVVYAERSGYVTGLNALKVANAAWQLGAGRRRKEDAVDATAGVRWFQSVGDYVHVNDPVLELHTARSNLLTRGLAELDGALTIGAKAPALESLVLKVVK